MNSPIRVLLVDDQEDDFVIIRALFQNLGDGFSLDWTGNFDEAIEKVSQRAHDVYLVDYRLGLRDGLEFLHEAYKKDCRAPVILMTGYGDHEIDLRAMKSGAADYLVKVQLSEHLLERSIRYSLHQAKILEELREREEGFRRLLDSSREGMVVHTKEGVILTGNPSAARIFGKESELIRHGLFEICDERLAVTVRECLEHPSEVKESEFLRKSDSRRFFLEVSTQDLQYRGAKALVTTFRDISKRKELEAQVLVQDRLASVGLLSSSLAHEIGTPLGVIRGRAEYLSMLANSGDGVKKSADIIVAQIDRVTQLIKALLNLSRGSSAVGKEPVSLTKVVCEVTDLLGYELRKSKIQLNLSGLLKETPRSHCQVNELSFWGPSAPESFNQVLLNLLVNSVHAIDSAKKRGKLTDHFIAIHVDQFVETGNSEAEKFWLLEVSDSGCGISKQNMSNLFKPFFTTKEIGVGTGLGLVSSYKIIQNIGGQILIDSTEMEGTKVSIRLPKAMASAGKSGC